MGKAACLPRTSLTLRMPPLALLMGYLAFLWEPSHEHAKMNFISALLHARNDFHKDTTRVTCSTTAGLFTIKLKHHYSPKGVNRFVELVKSGFFDGQLLYDVQPYELIQFGVAADPTVQAQWENKFIKHEKNLAPFHHGSVSFAVN